VIATGGGLGLLRSDLSPYTRRISDMIEQYDNVRFFACSRGLDRLRKQGVEPRLIPGVSSDAAGADHLIERLHHGWTYILI
jgi:intracellular sulfur oxidation DsrE/DsrF family protein